MDSLRRFEAHDRIQTLRKTADGIRIEREIRDAMVESVASPSAVPAPQRPVAIPPTPRRTACPDDHAQPSPA